MAATQVFFITAMFFLKMKILISEKIQSKDDESRISELPCQNSIKVDILYPREFILQSLTQFFFLALLGN